MNVDGLVSGLDTTSLISQLMQLERQPQTRLVARKTAMDKLADLYRQINTKLAAVNTASEDLNLASDWSVTKASSSDTARATVTGSGTAAPGTLTFRVESLASAKTVISDGSVASTSDVLFTSNFTVNGTTIDVGTGMSLAGVAGAISASDAGVNATVVRTGTDTYRLQLAAKVNGPAETIAVVGLDGGLSGFTTIVNEGSLARIHVGSGTAAGYDVESETNSIADVLPGVTITLVKADPTTDVTVTVAADPGAIADKVQKLVTAVNDTLKLIKDNSGYDEKTKKAGSLLTNQITSKLSNDLSRKVTDPVGDLATTAEALGIKIDRHGVATFDREKFLAAYDDDASLVQRFFVGTDTVDGLAERLDDWTTTATSLSTGPLNLALEGIARNTRTLDQQIDGWDTRLALREQALKRQFAAMEAALGQARSTSNWLAGQIASLPSFS